MNLHTIFDITASTSTIGRWNDHPPGSVVKGYIDNSCYDTYLILTAQRVASTISGKVWTFHELSAQGIFPKTILDLVEYDQLHHMDVVDIYENTELVDSSYICIQYNGKVLLYKIDKKKTGTHFG